MRANGCCFAFGLATARAGVCSAGTAASDSTPSASSASFIGGTSAMGRTGGRGSRRAATARMRASLASLSTFAGLAVRTIGPGRGRLAAPRSRAGPAGGSRSKRAPRPAVSCSHAARGARRWIYGAVVAGAARRSRPSLPCGAGPGRRLPPWWRRARVCSRRRVSWGPTWPERSHSSRGAWVTLPWPSPCSRKPWVLPAIFSNGPGMAIFRPFRPPAPPAGCARGATVPSWRAACDRHPAPPRPMPPFKLATFNINNVDRRLPQLLALAGQDAPDVVCLQETKVVDTAVPAGRDPGRRLRGALARPALLERRGHPGQGRRPGGDPPGAARRCRATTSAATWRRPCTACWSAACTCPTAIPSPGPKFAYKLAWFERLIAHAQALCDSGHPVVLAGDYNVVPTDFDIYNPRSWLKNALLQPESRAAYQRLLDAGLARRHPRPPPRRAHLHLLGLLPRSTGRATPACAWITCC